MPLDQVLSFLAFSVASAGTPGPSNTMIVASAASSGVVGGLRCSLGVSSGLGILLFSTSLGLSEAIIGHPLLVRIANIAAHALYRVAYRQCAG